MKSGQSPKCAVLGYGSWATAIVNTLTVNHHHVDWLVLNDDIRESLETRSLNSKYLPWCYIDREFFTAHFDSFQRFTRRCRLFQIINQLKKLRI